jgi:hypothetical protein
LSNAAQAPLDSDTIADNDVRTLSANNRIETIVSSTGVPRSASNTPSRVRPLAYFCRSPAMSAEWYRWRLGSKRRMNSARGGDAAKELIRLPL